MTRRKEEIAPASGEGAPRPSRETLPPAPEVAAVFLPLEELHPWDRNPRLNEAAVAEVMESIRRFGFANPILARAADRRVIAGHTRLKAAERLGLREVPVRLLDLDPVQADLLALADNRLGEIAQWDDAALGALLAELATAGEAVEASGFTPAEIADLIAAATPPDDPPDDPPPPDPGAGKEGAPAPGYSVQYNIVFDDETQQNLWYDYLKWLREAYPGETIAARLSAHLRTVLPPGAAE